MQPTPFQIFDTFIFFIAVIHTFLTPTLFTWSQHLKRLKTKQRSRWRFYHFASEMVYLLSEVEVVFGIWLIPLLIGYVAFFNWSAMVSYLNSRDYTQALYIMVIVVVIGSRPIIVCVEKFLMWIARAGGNTPAAWWWTILTIGPLLSIILKEPGAMALSAILLARKFYPYQPSRAFKYATLGLLFANVSIAGTLTPFASRSLLLVLKKWHWDFSYLFMKFGWKALVAILLANLGYFLFFHKEFESFRKPKTRAEKKDHKPLPPLWITLVHVGFVTLTALTGDHPPLFLGIFILYLGFHRATSFYQQALELKSAILVGFFFASLITHAELQGWWIFAVLKPLNEWGMMWGAFILSALVDNATILYLASEMPHLSMQQQYALVVGAMAAGGLSVIANAPNPIGHAILRSSFRGKISFSRLFMGAFFPTLIILIVFSIV